MEHTAECNAGAAKVRAAIEEYDRKWPDACENCNGAGGFTTAYDPSPPGVALSPGVMYDYDPCPECTGRETHSFRICECGCPEWDHEKDYTSGDRHCRACGCTHFRAQLRHNPKGYEESVYVDMGPAPLCPRCGLAALSNPDDGEGPCKACGWKGAEDARPEPWECYGCIEEPEVP